MHEYLVMADFRLIFAKQSSGAIADLEKTTSKLRHKIILF